MRSRNYLDVNILRQATKMKNQLAKNPLKFLIRLSTLAVVAIAMVGCYDETQPQTDYSQEIRDRNVQPTPEASPAPTVQPIDPFYGSCHHYDCK